MFSTQYKVFVYIESLAFQIKKYMTNDMYAIWKKLN